jgi:hypothetical protein
LGASCHAARLKMERFLRVGALPSASAMVIAGKAVDVEGRLRDAATRQPGLGLAFRGQVGPTSY